MMVRIIISIVSLLLVASSANAQYFEERAAARKYQECIALVSEDSSAALTVSREWYLKGGGVAAQHCEALALFEMRRYNDAAGIFELAASKLMQSQGQESFAERNKDVLALQLNYLAGVAWRTAGELDKSYNALSASLNELQNKPAYAYEVYIERGQVQFALEDFDSARDDFTNALDIDAEKIDAFLYRAQVFRKLDEHLKARLDLNAALAISPNQPEILLESGINYRMQRNDEKALIEWEKLIEKHPGTEWQKMAQDNINLIGQ